MRTLHACSFATLLLAACKTQDDAPPKGPWQTERDEALRYELLEPHDHAFEITYTLSATTPGATTYCTPVRGDTYVSDVRAENVDTGAALDVALVGGADARAKGHPGASPDGSYFLVALDRPVPEHGELRLLVHTRYEDRDSYAFRGDELVFERLLAAPEVEVVLPPLHALVECNVPVRMEPLADGRIALSYGKRGRVPFPLRIVARRVAEPTAEATSARLAPPFACTPRAGLVQALEAELDGADAGRWSWRHDLECLRELDHPPVVTIGAHAEEPAAFLRATGARLESRPAEAAGEAPRALAWDGAERLRLEGRTRIEAARDAHALRLAFEPAPLRAVFLPAGWSPLRASIPVSATPLADGRTRLDLGFGPVEFEGLELELWRPRAPREVQAPPPVAPKKPAQRELD